MAISEQLVLVRMEDIKAFAEARALVALARDACAATPARAADGALDGLRRGATAVGALVAEGLRAPGGQEQVRRLRDAGAVLAGLRLAAWEAYADGALASPLFDDVMVAIGRCRREVQSLEASARHLARRRIDEA